MNEFAADSFSNEVLGYGADLCTGLIKISVGKQTRLKWNGFLMYLMMTDDYLCILFYVILCREFGLHGSRLLLQHLPLQPPSSGGEIESD